MTAAAHRHCPPASRLHLPLSHALEPVFSLRLGCVLPLRLVLSRARRRHSLCLPTAAPATLAVSARSLYSTRSRWVLRCAVLCCAALCPVVRHRMLLLPLPPPLVLLPLNRLLQAFPPRRSFISACTHCRATRAHSLTTATPVSWCCRQGGLAAWVHSARTAHAAHTRLVPACSKFAMALCCRGAAARAARPHMRFLLLSHAACARPTSATTRYEPWSTCLSPHAPRHPSPHASRPAYGCYNPLRDVVNVPNWPEASSVLGDTGQYTVDELLKQKKRWVDALPGTHPRCCLPQVLFVRMDTDACTDGAGEAAALPVLLVQRAANPSPLPCCPLAACSSLPAASAPTQSTREWGQRVEAEPRAKTGHATPCISRRSRCHCTLHADHRAPALS